jgi:hypothetical protein
MCQWLLPGMRLRLLGGITAEGYRITALSLDDPTLFRPQFELFTSDAQPWSHVKNDERRQCPLPLEAHRLW